MKRIVLLASGAGSLAKAVIEANLSLEIVRVVSDRQAPVLEVARRSGIPTALVDFTAFPTRREWAEKLDEVISNDDADLVVSVGFMRILPKEFVEKHKVINTHPALLPDFPGAHAVRDALAAKVTRTGCTVHWVDAGVDTGAVIAQVSVSVAAEDTEETLHERIKIQERQLIVETLKKFSEGLL